MIALRLFILGCTAIVLVLAQEPTGTGKTEFIVTGTVRDRGTRIYRKHDECVLLINRVEMVTLHRHLRSYDGCVQDLACLPVDNQFYHA